MSLLRALLSTVSSAARAMFDVLSRGLEATGQGLSALGRGVVALLPGEWKKPIAALFVAGLATVPLVYSGNMTWSFLDPSNNLDQVTAAVVNEDRAPRPPGRPGDRAGGRGVHGDAA